MDVVTQIKLQNKRYVPHELSTKINSVKLYRQAKDINFVLHQYHISKASLVRWNKQYDSTKESLVPKSHHSRKKTRFFQSSAQQSRGITYYSNIPLALLRFPNTEYRVCRLLARRFRHACGIDL